MAAESKTLGALFPEMDIEALSAILAVTGGDVVAAERMILEGSPVATSESNADAAFAQTLADEELARQLQQQWVAETRVAEAGEERGEGSVNMNNITDKIREGAQALSLNLKKTWTSVSQSLSSASSKACNESSQSSLGQRRQSQSQRDQTQRYSHLLDDDFDPIHSSPPPSATAAIAPLPKAP